VIPLNGPHCNKNFKLICQQKSATLFKINLFIFSEEDILEFRVGNFSSLELTEEELLFEKGLLGENIEPLLLAY
jgi:hypothetical protein